MLHAMLRSVDRWGTHEKELPHDGEHHTFGSDAAIFLNRPGCTTKVSHCVNTAPDSTSVALDRTGLCTCKFVCGARAWVASGTFHNSGVNALHDNLVLRSMCCLAKVRTWTPTEGPFHGFLVTHNESISIADYFTVKVLQQTYAGDRLDLQIFIEPGNNIGGLIALCSGDVLNALRLQF